MAHKAEHHRAAEALRQQAAELENLIAAQRDDLSFEDIEHWEQQVIDLKAAALHQDNCTCTNI